MRKRPWIALIAHSVAYFDELAPAAVTDKPFGWQKEKQGLDERGARNSVKIDRASTRWTPGAKCKSVEKQARRNEAAG